jgi:1-acyl-sn-glycerol-3-phosphate acyltransferase
MLYIRAVNGTRFVNRRALKKIKGGFFLYGNHTHWSDAYLPHVAAAVKRTYIIASPDAVSVRGLRSIVQMLGAIPIPTQTRALRPFYKAVRQRSGEGACIAVYPEAHIWPYYTGIRPFPATSFVYPAELGVPVVAMVTVYRKRKVFKSPARTVILSDPIYAEPGMSMREAQRCLHQRISEFMTEKTGSPDNYAHIRYEQR